jgi:hypothetical protein
MANDGLRFGITLQIGGVLVSGILVSGNEYFNGFAEDLAGGFKDKQLVEPIREAFMKLGDVYKTEMLDKSVAAEPVFIHVKEARFFLNAGTPIPTTARDMVAGSYFRGRRVHVR